MTELTDLSIADALDQLESGDITAKQLVSAHVDAARDAGDLNLFITDTFDDAIEQAVKSDERRAKGQAGLIDGIPLGIKDLFCTKGVRTTAASKILHDFVPPYESTVTKNLFDAGGIMLGKCSLDEFAMGSSNTTSYFGNVHNPIDNPNGDTPLVPGGSSGGSAAAIAARIAMGATGTDTGGSIRQPASFCGVTGIKPTYGRCSRWGIIAFASSLDQAGPIARSVTDCAIMLEAMAGYDEKDSTSVNMPVPDFRALVDNGVDGMTIGIPDEYRVDGIPDEINQMWEDGIEWLKSAGASVKNISLPHTEHALATYYIIAPAEASSNLARYDGVRYGLRVDGDDLIDTYKNTRSEGFGEEVQRRILIGTYVLSAGYYDAYYNQARRVRSLIAQDFEQVFEDGIDAILTPTAPSAAFEIGANTDDPVQMYLNDIFTIPTSLAGLPGMSLPAGRDSDGLPLGLQIIGRPFDEETVFRVGRCIERHANMPAGAVG